MLCREFVIVNVKADTFLLYVQFLFPHVTGSGMPGFGGGGGMSSVPDDDDDEGGGGEGDDDDDMPPLEGVEAETAAAAVGGSKAGADVDIQEID